jgi:hypothetical protein
MMPLFYADESSTIGESQAAIFRSSLYHVLTIRSAVFWASVAASVVMAGVAVALLVTTCRRDSEEYFPINAPRDESMAA